MIVARSKSYAAFIWGGAAKVWTKLHLCAASSEEEIQVLLLLQYFHALRQDCGHSYEMHFCLLAGRKL
jgi:hypothetical protein